ncbi:MAG: hypothetical protein REJ50_01660, partial [Bordetella sp.]|nr:hypothetical protein [Bordetella sp.]
MRSDDVTAAVSAVASVPEVRQRLLDLQREYIGAVEGNSTKEMANIYSALVDTAGKAITLIANRTPEEEGAREVVIT